VLSLAGHQGADGNVVNSMLSDTCDRGAAKRFSAQVRTLVGYVPEKVTTGGRRRLSAPSARRGGRSVYRSTPFSVTLLSVSNVAMTPIMGVALTTLYT